jgi:hypothetical protein
MQEFYIKMTIDGETYDPFSAETLKVLPPPHKSFREEIIAASRRKYTISADAAKKLIAEEEAMIFRSAQEKAIIEGKKSTLQEKSKTKDKEENIEPLI